MASAAESLGEGLWAPTLSASIWARRACRSITLRGVLGLVDFVAGCCKSSRWVRESCVCDQPAVFVVGAREYFRDLVKQRAVIFVGW